MSWASTLPTVALLLLLLYVPGWFLLRSLGLHGLLAVAAAPAPTVAILAAAGVGLAWLGIPWSIWTGTLILLLAVVAVELVARRLLRTRIMAHPLPVRMAWVVGLGVLTGLIVQAAAYLPGMREPDALHQVHDAIFHLNATQAMVSSGNASSLSAIGELEGMRPSFYPMVFDAIAALVAPLSSVVAAVNIVMLVMLVVIWPVGIVALTRVVAPSRPLAAAVAPVAAASFIMFPANFIILQGALPYGLVIALAPAVTAVLVKLLDLKAAGRPLGWLQPVLIATLLVAGVTAAHPTGLAVLAVYVLPKCVQVTFRAGSRLLRQGRTVRGVVSIAAVPVVVIMALVAMSVVPTLRSMTENRMSSEQPFEALFRGFTGATTIGSSGLWANWFMAGLLVAGLILVMLDPRIRWFGFSWILAVLCLVLSSLPNSVWRNLTGFWYASNERTESMVPTLTSVLVGIATSVAATWVAGLFQRPDRRTGAPTASPDRREAVAVLAAATILLLGYLSSGEFRLVERRDDWTAWGFQADRILHEPFVTDDELVMIRSLADTLPPSAVVIGDPASGETFVQGVAGLVAYIPALNSTGWGPDQRYLMDHFRDIHSDPRVCEIVRESRIEYYYWDVYNGAGLSPPRPGLTDVDTGTGFELVASADTAKVFRITACDPNPS